MRIAWSFPVRGERLDGTRGDLVRACHMVAALRRDGHEVHVVEAAQRPASRIAVAGYRQLARRLVPRRGALVLRDLGRALDGRSHGVRLARTATSCGVDLIIETQVGFAASGAVAALRSGVPLVVDDCSPSREESALGAGLPALAAAALRRLAAAAAVVVAVCRASRDALLAEGLPEEKICIVPNGVDVAAFERDACACVRQLTRRRLGIDQGEIVVGFAGSFQPWHRVELLVEALARLRRRHSLRVLLVGDGPGLLGVLTAARESGVEERVLALGAVLPSEIPALLGACDIGVLPGTNDYGHPMKLLEYAAAGLPSVAPDLRAVRDELIPGATGLLFPPNDASALTEALARLVADAALRGRLGAEARSRALRCASWEQRVQVLLDALAEKGIR